MEQFTIYCSRGYILLCLFLKCCILSNLLYVCIFEVVLLLFSVVLCLVILYFDFNVYRASLKISIQLLSGSPYKKNYNHKD